MQVELTVLAEQDIIEHYLYGYEHFGKRQADLYEAKIRETFSLIGGNPELAAERSDYSPPIRIHHTGKHYIAYTVDDNCVLVLRVLREEAELSQQLAR